MTLPDRLKSRPQFQGFVIPYMAFIRPDGTPDFKINDIERWIECAKKLLCAICGEGLDYWVWYLGSKPMVEQKVYYDLGMHEECARFAAATCPFVNGSKNYADYIKPPGEGVFVTELATREEVGKEREMYLAKGRRGTIKVDFQERRIHVGTLVAIELVSVRKTV